MVTSTRYSCPDWNEPSYNCSTNEGIVNWVTFFPGGNTSNVFLSAEYNMPSSDANTGFPSSILMAATVQQSKQLPPTEARAFEKVNSTSYASAQENAQSPIVVIVVGKTMLSLNTASSNAYSPISVTV